MLQRYGCVPYFDIFDQFLVEGSRVFPRENGLGLSIMQVALGLLGQMSTVQLEQNASCLTIQRDTLGTNMVSN